MIFLPQLSFFSINGDYRRTILGEYLIRKNTIKLTTFGRKSPTGSYKALILALKSPTHDNLNSVCQGFSFITKSFIFQSNKYTNFSILAG